jgi:hypothetical protein
MHALTIDWDPPRRRLRHFAWVLALLLAVLALLLTPSPHAWPLRLAAALVFAGGTVLPRLFRWPYFAFLVALYPVFWVIHRKLAPLLSARLRTWLSLCFRLLGLASTC